MDSHSQMENAAASRVTSEKWQESTTAKNSERELKATSGRSSSKTGPKKATNAGRTSSRGGKPPVDGIDVTPTLAPTIASKPHFTADSTDSPSPAPTPTSFIKFTEAPTPTTYRETTRAPTPTTYRDTTRAPTPTTYTSTTRAPTPTTYRDTTLAPTPTSYSSGSRAPTSMPTSFIDGFAYSNVDIAVAVIALVAIIVALVLYFIGFFNASKEQPPASSTHHDTESTPFLNNGKDNNSSANTFHISPFSFLATQYSTGGMRPVSVFMSGHELSWEVMSGSKRKNKINVKDIMFVEIGKETYNFRKVTGTSAVEDRCFSLVTESATLDLEVESKEQRDRLVSQFINILNSNKSDL